MTTRAEETPAKKGNNRLTKVLLETAGDMHAMGVMTKATHEEIQAAHGRCGTEGA